MVDYQNPLNFCFLALFAVLFAKTERIENPENKSYWITCMIFAVVNICIAAYQLMSGA